MAQPAPAAAAPIGVSPALFEFQLETAIRNKNERETMKLLKGAIDTNFRNSSGKTPLYVAVEVNSIEIAKTLLEAGAKPNLATPTGFAPLHIAARNNDEAMCRLLLHHGADPSMPNGIGFTSLQLADVRSKAWLLLKKASDTGTVTPPPPEPLEHAKLPDIVYTWIRVQQKKQEILEEAKKAKKKKGDKKKKK